MKFKHAKQHSKQPEMRKFAKEIAELFKQRASEGGSGWKVETFGLPEETEQQIEQWVKTSKRGSK